MIEGNCYITVGGTDCRIQESVPFSPRLYYHKFNGPGLRYEVGVCISTGNIFWISGTYPCGEYSDVKIFRLLMKRALDSEESSCGRWVFR